MGVGLPADLRGAKGDGFVVEHCSRTRVTRLTYVARHVTEISNLSYLRRGESVCGTFRTLAVKLAMSAYRGKADLSTARARTQMSLIARDSFLIVARMCMRR